MRITKKSAFAGYIGASSVDYVEYNPSKMLIGMTDSKTEKFILFEQFIDRYYPSIFGGVQKLTGPVDKLVLEKLTVEIFIDLWEHSDELFRPLRKPAFVYKILVKHVVDWLKKQGATEQLLFLQNTLLIDPEQDL